MTRFRIGLVALALFLSAFGCSMQAPTPPEQLTPVTVAAAKQMVDRTPVMLEGYLIQPLGNETYLFQDPTGQIMAEIGDNDWLNVRVGPKTKVRIIGKIDGDYGSADLDVKVEQIQVLQQEVFPKQ